MQHRLIGLAVVIVGLGGAAQAADAPSLTGTWSGKGTSVSKSEGWETERSYTLVITEQRGQVFKGHNEWPGGQDEVLGVVKADGSSLLLTNADGVSSATLIDADSMEACYAEGGDDAMAVCVTLTRTR